MARDDKNGVWIALESTRGTDPSANGSGYKACPAEVVGKIRHGPELLETNYQTTRGLPTARVVGPDSAAIDIDFPWIGLSAAAGDGAAPPADDWLDLILTHLADSQTKVNGEGVSSSSGTTLTLDTDIYNVQQVVPVYESGLPSGAPRTVWGFIETDSGGGGYVVSHTPGFNFTTAAVAYGTTGYLFGPTPAGNTASLYVVEDDVGWMLSMARCTRAQLVGEAGRKIVLRTSWIADRRTRGTKASAPTILPAAPEPIQLRLSPLHFNGTEYAIKSFTYDFGLQVVEVPGSTGTNGRADIRHVGNRPTLTVVPEYQTGLQDARDAGTRGRLQLQLGGGVLASSILNTSCLHAHSAQVLKADGMNDGRVKRQDVQFEIVDEVEFSAGVASRFAQLLRA